MVIKEGYKQTEIGVIPMDWELRTLGELGKFKNGINKSAEDFGFGFPFANLMDVFGKTSIKSNKKFGLINSNEAERKLYNLLGGDVLFIRSSVKPSGVGLTSLIEENFNETVFSGFIIRFRENGSLANGYKKHCFYEEKFRNNIIGSSTVSANTNINQESLKKILLAFPKSLKEQTAIANALSDADELINGLEKLIAKKRNIKQGAMQQLLQPKEGWEVKKLGEVCDFYNGKGHEQSISENGNYIVVNSKFVSTQGEVYKCSTENLFPLEKNDITIVMSDIPNGKALAKCFIIPEDNKYTLNQRIGAIRTNIVDYKFLYFILNRNDYYLAFDSGTGQTNLKKNDVLNCPLILPPTKEEQTRIASILTDMVAELSAIEQKLEKYKKVKLGMMQELLTGKTRLV